MNNENKSRFETNRPQISSMARLLDLCRECYEKAQRRLATIKFELEREFSQAMAGYERLLKSALNEAEAVAWQTPFPHLFFPLLAEEKAIQAQRWAARQRETREVSESRYRQAEILA